MTETRAEYRVDGRIEIRRECLLPFADISYLPPSPVEIREVIQRLGLTSSEAGKMSGVDRANILSWTSGELEIPYAA